MRLTNGTRRRRSLWARPPDDEEPCGAADATIGCVSYEANWRDQSSSWWVKANRAKEHLDSLRRQVDEFRASEPYALIPESADTPNLTAYRLAVRWPFPVGISATIGDILHNLRAALESLAYEVARCCHDGTVPEHQERESTFPIFANPEGFERFFTHPKRVGLYDDRAREAFRAVQPFRQLEVAHGLGIALDRTFDEEYLWDKLHGLNVLWNIDKHRRIPLMAWWPALIYWGSDGATNRRLLPGDGTMADGSVLFYIEGQDEGQGDEISHDFHIVLTDDPAHRGGAGAKPDVVDMLTNWHSHIVGWVFPTVFSMMSRPTTPDASA